MDLKERTANPSRHPWELSRADMVLDLLSQNARGTRYADVGSGDLYFAGRLRELTDAPIYAIDVNYGTQDSESQLVVCTDLDQVPPESVDCAILMDVLEHVRDDLAFLHAVDRILTPKGQLLVTVPAHSFLWSDHDLFLGHYRRYNHSSLTSVLERSGHDVVESFYFYAVPYLARALSVGVSKLGVPRKHAGAVSRWRHSIEHPVTKAVRAMLNADFRVSRMLGSGPLSGCGLSICAICRRTSA